MALLPTWDLLLSLGFVEDPDVISDDPGGLNYDFGNFKLEASHLTNRRFQSVVLLSGILVLDNSIGEVECEMPCAVESREQGIAWITWCLDEHAHGEFIPARPVSWLGIGRQYRHLLPWEKEIAAYEARPRCLVQRDFARVGLRYLSELIATAVDDVPVMFAFDGEVLSIRIKERLIVMPAEGNRWEEVFSIRAGTMRDLPKD
jgi:hypothetical protein